MPNHVQSLLKITGEERVIAQLVEFVREGKEPFAFEKIVPQPVCVYQGNLGAAESEANPGRNWYAWNSRRWGTKWGAYAQQIRHRGEGCVHFGYQSAWSEGRPVIDELAMLFPDLRIEHHFIDEHGQGGCNGTVVYEPADPHVLARGDEAEARRRDVETSTGELHVLIHGCTKEQYFGDDAEEAADAP